jgi:hypothetical protein
VTDRQRVILFVVVVVVVLGYIIAATFDVAPR